MSISSIDYKILNKNAENTYFQLCNIRNKNNTFFLTPKECCLFEFEIQFDLADIAIIDLHNYGSPVIKSLILIQV